MSANVRLWLHPPGQKDAQAIIAAAISNAAAKRNKAFSRQCRETADTWLFIWSPDGDMRQKTYAAFTRYFGLALPGTFGERPKAIGGDTAVWGCEIGKFPWPAAGNLYKEVEHLVAGSGDSGARGAREIGNGDGSSELRRAVKNRLGTLRVSRAGSSSHETVTARLRKCTLRARYAGSARLRPGHCVYTRRGPTPRRLRSKVSRVKYARKLNCCAAHVCWIFRATRGEQNQRNGINSLESLFRSRAPAMMEKGLSRSHVLRLLACALELLERCRSVWDDMPLMACVALRLSAKFELNSEHKDIVLDLLKSPETEPALLPLECRLMNLLWSRGESPIEVSP